MDIPRSFLLALVLLSIVSICMGVLTVTDVVSRFDGLVVASDGSVLDIGDYLKSEEGKNYMVDYINTYITPQTNIYKLDSSHVQFDGYNFADGKLSPSQSSNANLILSTDGIKTN